jgi:pyruvate/2-oxoglutarate dehydrogenase complex dihydrolipoamide dehydrogenase (E3) component
MSFEILVIGSEPGGYVTAMHAAQLRSKTAIVEPEYLGDISLNWGCIPTKVLLCCAEVYTFMRHSQAMASQPRIFGSIRGNDRKVISSVLAKVSA